MDSVQLVEVLESYIWSEHTFVVKDSPYPRSMRPHIDLDCNVVHWNNLCAWNSLKCTNHDCKNSPLSNPNGVDKRVDIYSLYMLDTQLHKCSRENNLLLAYILNGTYPSHILHPTYIFVLRTVGNMQTHSVHSNTQLLVHNLDKSDIVQHTDLVHKPALKCSPHLKHNVQYIDLYDMLEDSDSSSHFYRLVRIFLVCIFLEDNWTHHKAQYNDLIDRPALLDMLVPL